MVFVMFMLGVGFSRQKLKPRIKIDQNLGIGLEVWQISWQVILLNLFWYSVKVISPITRCASVFVGLDGSARKASLLKICSLNIDSCSSTCYSSSKLSLWGFLNCSWRICCFRLFWIRLDLPFLGGCFRFPLPFPSMLLSPVVLLLRVLVLGSDGCLDFLTFYDFPLCLAPLSVALDGWPTCPWHEELFWWSLFSACVT